MEREERFFLYISDTKVDALLGQISQKRLKKIHGALEVNLKAIKANVSGEWENTENRVTRFLAVEKYLEDEGRISNIYKPGHWVAGTTRVKTISIADNDEVVFYLSDLDEEIFVLGGSSKHRIGHSNIETLKPVWSFEDRLIAALKSHAESQRRPVEEDPEKILSDLRSVTGGSTHAWCDLIYRLSEKTQEPYTTIRYLARVLLADKHRKQQICLATPLYVAQFNQA